jgi:hypothetical protein
VRLLTVTLLHAMPKIMINNNARSDCRSGGGGTHCGSDGGGGRSGALLLLLLLFGAYPLAFGSALILANYDIICFVVVTTKVLFLCVMGFSFNFSRSGDLGAADEGEGVDLACGHDWRYCCDNGRGSRGVKHQRISRMKVVPEGSSAEGATHSPRLLSHVREHHYHRVTHEDCGDQGGVGFVEWIVEWP